MQVILPNFQYEAAFRRLLVFALRVCLDFNVTLFCKLFDGDTVVYLAV